MGGKLSETARLISRMDERLKTAESRMVSPREMEVLSEEVLRSLNEETLKEINRLRDETGAQITSISQRFSRIQAEMNKGFSKFGVVASAPPEKWGGVRAEEVGWCISSPSSCEVTPFSWVTEYEVGGFPVAQFKSENIWGQEFSLKLNLAFRVLTIGLSERDEDGAVQNQGVHIQAG
jgi:hypothetical protein